jgi:uncharacterized protein YyaL (SSP411 family)
MAIEFLLREYLRSGEQSALDMVTLTLRRMAQGGMHDQLGGGFARYSTDQRWLVPHFEKMLYDNAQLARLYLRAFQVSGDNYFREVAERTLDYVLREMRHEAGGFYSSQDADSEGEEGKFFVWSVAELRAALGADAELFMRVYGVSEQGNWEGRNILHLEQPREATAVALGMDPGEAGLVLDRCRQKLFRLRSQRVWPGLDNKVLTAWNGLMLGALAEAGRVLGRTDYLSAAIANAEFLQRALRREDGRLLRTWKAGASAKYNAYLEDHACLAEGLLSLYEASFDARWMTWAGELVRLMQEHFKDPQGPGYYDTSDDHEALIHRPRDLQDNAMPSGNAKAAMVLFRFGLYSGDETCLRAAEESVAAQAGMMQQYPGGFGEWLSVAGFILGEPRELALVGPADELRSWRAIINERYRPNLVVAAGLGADAAQIPLLADRPMVNARPTAYLCQRFTCRTPITDPAELRVALSGS